MSRWHSGGKGPVILVAAPLSHNDPDEPPSPSGSPTTDKKPRKDWRITDRFHVLLACCNQIHATQPLRILHGAPYTTGTQLVSSSLVTRYIKGERMSTFTNDRQTHAER